MTATTQISGLASRYQALFDDVIATVNGATDEQWRAVTDDEQWPLGVVAHHLAIAQGGFVNMMDVVTSGEGELTGATMEQIHEGNAQHAREHANATKAETLDLLNSNTSRAVNLINRLKKEQLDQFAVVFAGYEMNVGSVVELIGIGHPTGHLESLKTSLAS